jgi:hypothetical protein
MIETSYSNHTSTKLPAELHLRRGVAPDSPRETLQLNTGNGFRLQAEAFREHILTGPATWTGVQQDESIDIAITLEALSRSAHNGCVVTLDS